MEKEKHYTPILKEFNVGFEFEQKERFGDGTVKSKEDFDKAKWIPRIMEIGELPYIERMLNGKNALNGIFGLRVKFLDRQDIESFGFFKRIKDEWIGWKDYSLDTISGEITYFLSATIHVPRMDDKYKIYLHRYLDDDTGIESRINEGESELVYKGKIKNRSELNRLLKQLSII